MKKLIVIMMVFVFLFSSCAKRSDAINVYNWGDYIDESILDDFEKEYGIKVNYQTYGSNEDLYVKIKNAKEAYDVVFPSEYMASKMINEDLLYEYDVTELENYKNISSNFRNLDYDKHSRYCIPYFWGTMGLVYNKNMVDEKDMESFASIFDDKYKEEVFMFDAQRDVIGVGLKMLGYSLNTRNMDELDEAKKLMTAQKKYVRAYVTDNMKSLMLSSEGAIGYTDSGAAFQIIFEGGEENFGYKIPKEGSNLWIDVMVIPKNAKHKESAKLFINYLMREDVAQKNMNYVQYASPLKTAQNPLEDNKELWDKFQPTDEQMKRCEVYTDLGENTKDYNQAWIYIKANN